MRRAGLRLGCATVLVLAGSLSQAQQWRAVSEDFGRTWAVDTSSLARIDDDHIRVWMQFTLPDPIPGPRGSMVKHIRGLWRINCRDGWYEHIADDARSEDLVQVGGGPKPPERITRDYPRAGEPSLQVVRIACMLAAK